jgi:hypothetical protein
MYLFDETISTPAIKINPYEIRVEQVSAGQIEKMQPLMSKANWRPAPGRKLGFQIMFKNHLLGIAFLASPVINLGPRDIYLNLPKNKSEKGKELRHFADLSVCVPAQPFGWHWNGGKLIAMLSTTFGDFWTDRYGDELKGICTTSLWGKSTQYNRIFKLIGYTQGFGHEHITDERYEFMMNWLKENGHEIPSSKFGAGSNPRMRRIAAYKKASGDKTFTMKHGNKRGIYYHPSVNPDLRMKIILNWHDRWGLPRFNRTQNQIPPYNNGLENGKERTA